MSKIFVGGIPEESNRLLNTYLSKFLPDAEVEPLKASGIKGRIKNHAKRTDVIMVIIEEALYQMCVGVADDVLAMSKVHKYVDDDSLNQFLISKFGRLEENNSIVDIDENKAIDVSDLDISLPISVSETIVCSEIIENNDNSSNLQVSDSIIEEQVSPQVTHAVDLTNSLLPVNDKLSDVDDLIVVDDEQRDIVEKKLKTQIQTNELIIINLRGQIEELTNCRDDDDNLSSYITKINELEVTILEKETELENNKSQSYTDLGKIARAEQIIIDLDKLKNDLKLSKDSISSLEHDKLVLTEKFNSLQVSFDKQLLENTRLIGVESEYMALFESNKELNDKFSEYKVQLEEFITVKASLTLEVDNLKSSVASLQRDSADKIVLEERLNDLGQKYKKSNEMVKSLEDKVSDYGSVSLKASNLEVDINSLQSEKSSLETKLRDMENSLKTKTTDFTTLQRQYSSLQNDIVSKENAISGTSKEVSDLNAEILRLVADNTSSSSRISDLELELSSKEAELASSVSSIATLKEKLSNTSNGVSDISEKIRVLENDIEVKNNEISKLSFDLESVTKLLSIEKATSDNLSLKVTNLTSEINISNSKVSELNLDLSKKISDYNLITTELDSANEELDTKAGLLASAESSIVTLELSIKKLENELVVLKDEKSNTDTIATDELTSQISVLEEKLTDNKRMLAQVEKDKESLVEELRKAKDTSSRDMEVANLRIKITELQAESRDKDKKLLQNSSKSADEVTNMENELSRLKDRNYFLECDTLDKDDQIKEFRENIFVAMSDYALPKVTYPLSVSVPLTEFSNMYTFASGSAESSISLYQLLRKQVTSNNNINYLIVDLVTDTYIDRELGVKSIKSPVPWLQGSDKVDDYVAETKFSNVKVISTALAYMNDLYFLNVDWSKRLAELSVLADIVIINVGTLDNVIHNTLFNSFSSITKCHVIVKATPINLRTAILHLTGFSQLRNTLVSCVNFSEEQSKGLYQKLSAKFPAQILKDSDILQL